MVRKFVIDPAAIKDDRAFVHFVRGLGVDQGRLLALYPKDWRVRALEHVPKEANTRSSMLIQAALDMLRVDGSLLSKSGGIPYSVDIPWADNVADNAHAFAAGLVPDGAVQDPKPPIYVVSTLSDVPEPEYWQVDGSVHLQANSAEALVGQLKPLLDLEPEAAFMDPYCVPEKSFAETFKRIFSTIPKLQRITVHSKMVETTGERWQSDWSSILKDLLPIGVTFTVVRWREGKQRPHMRWVVNTRGGITSDTGFASNLFENTLWLQSREIAHRNWNQFGRGPWSDGKYLLKDVLTFRDGEVSYSSPS